MTTINDFSLVGFWPLNEPSGSPIFYNWAPKYSSHPSGLSFDFHVHITDSDVNEPRTVWPGTSNILVPGSGIEYRGFMAQGDANKNDNDGPAEKVLTLGLGGFADRRILTTPQVANSGFTCGLWVLPNSNGYDSIATVSMTKALLGQHHALVSKGGAAAGFFIGVSGKLDNDARNSDIANYQLRGYGYLQGSLTTNSVLLDSPIESGRYTHLTVTYRHVDGTNNQWVLYKDGRVAGSGTTNQELSNATATFNDTPLCVGGSLVATDRITNATGWGHFISGVYAFERPLHEGEVLAIHNAGGLQGDSSNIKNYSTLNINSDDIIGYYPFISHGFVDASKNAFPMVSDFDEGAEDGFIVSTGPFNRGGIQNANNSSPTLAVVSTSGTTNLLLSAASNAGFTIAGWFSPKGTSSYLNNILFSFGSIGTTETPTLDYHSAGFFVGARTGTNSVRPFAKIFNGGNPSDSLTLTGVDSDIFTSTYSHYALIYDNASNGVAFYINAKLQNSGTLSSSLSNHLTRLAYSGFPICFLNGVSNATIDVFATNGGQDSGGSEFAIFKKPLRQDELNFLCFSGISIAPLQYTPNDPRLRGYWKCTETNSETSPLIPDRAMAWKSVPANLIRTLSDLGWSTIQNSDATGPLYRVDYFGKTHASIPALSSYGNLGITSGTYAIMGGSAGIHAFTASSFDDRNSSLMDWSLRFKPSIEERDIRHQSFYGEYILSFDITPSGQIPSSVFPEGQEFNSLIFSYGQGGSVTTSDRLISYITSINANGSVENPASSGVSIVFLGWDGAVTATTPLVSGNLKFGVPNKVLFHLKPQNRHYFGDTPTTHRLLASLYIDGTLVHAREEPVSTARAWSDQIVATTSDKWLLEFGGYATDDTFNTVVNKDCGLGNIYLRNIFVMTGKFSQGDLNHLSASGLYDTTLNATGYSNTQDTTFVDITDTGLKGYYRFTGGPGGSGTQDLSINNNHLTNLAGAVGHAFALPGNAAYNLRFVPGPLNPSDLNIPLSGITYEGNSFSSTNSITPFALSGTAFNTPENGFSIGFWYCQRAETGTNDAKIIASYGRTPTNVTATASTDSVWAVCVSAADDIHLHLSMDGRMYIDAASNSAKGGSVECGTTRSSISTFVDDNLIELNKAGYMEPGHIDSWNHYVWTYNPTSKYVKCYFNGALIDQKIVPSGLNTPDDPTDRIINFLVPMSSTWSWNTNLADFDGVLSDFFYFNRELSESEAKYIAFNGIADAPASNASGVTGGYIYGSDLGSGILGSYIQGLGSISGLIGSYIDSAFLGSGIVGAYIDGLDFANSHSSGLIGSFIQGLSNSSGLIGAFIMGGLSGRLQFDGRFSLSALSGVFFDAISEIKKTAAASFDAKMKVYNQELVPDVRIIIPEMTVSGLTPPFNQYFIGFASGLQGKTITQTRWSFGDFNPSITGTVSGLVYYPIQYRINNSGFYIVRFEAIDSEGMHSSATRYINAASGIDPVRIALSGIPQYGNATLDVAFSQSVVTIPNNISIINSLLYLDNGSTTSIPNTTYSYTTPGKFNPIWVIRDSRGIIWSDSLEPGIDSDKQ